MSQNHNKKIQIKYENAINYKPDADSDYFVSDLLQNRTVGVIDKHYRQKDFENSLKLAEKQSKIANLLLK